MSKLIFLDIDGTMVDFNQKMPESTVEALRLVREHGHKIVICTGRVYSNIYAWLLDMEFDAVVASTGAYIVSDGQVIYHHVLDTEKLRQLAKLLKGHHAYYMLQGTEAGYMDKDSALWMQQYFEALGIQVKGAMRHLRFVEEPAIQPMLESGMYYGADIGIDQMQQEIDAKIDGYFAVAGASFGTEQEYNGEITRQGIHKGTGMLRLAEHLGIDRSDIVGVGDGPNDHDMIRTASIGIVMGNGIKELKEEADYVTDAIDQDGIWNAFAHYGWI